MSIKALELDLKTFINFVGMAQTSNAHEYFTDIQIALWLTIEAGEAADLILKNGVYKRELNKEALTSELGDVLHLVCALALRHNIKMSDIMRDNVNKLERRGWLV